MYLLFKSINGKDRKRCLRQIRMWRKISGKYQKSQTHLKVNQKNLLEIDLIGVNGDFKSRHLKICRNLFEIQTKEEKMFFDSKSKFSFLLKETEIDHTHHARWIFWVAEITPKSR